MMNESLEVYKLAIREYPNSFQLFYSCGDILSDNKNEMAFDCYRKCIDLYNNNSENLKLSQEFEKALNKIKEKKTTS